MEDARFAEMISKIAHELRSPLTSVKGFSATLVNRWDRFNDDQKRQFVETIHSDAERMGRIVSEVLDLARLESGRLELHPVGANIHAIATQALEHLHELPGSDRVVLDIDEKLQAWADVERLGHVFRNLIENGIKFSDDGAIKIAAHRENSEVTIEISDAGVGIPGDRLPHVFSGPGPTGQVSGPSGSGLGLYLTKRLIEAHGGSIEAASEEGQGATFTVVLPAQEPGGAPSDGPQEKP